MLKVKDARKTDAASIDSLLTEYYPKYEGDDDVAAEFLKYNGGAIIAYDDDDPIGVCLYTWGVSLSERAKKMEVELCYVTPSHRGKGIGTLLLQTAAKRARKAQCGIILWAWSTGDEKACRHFLTSGARYTGGAVFAVPFEDIAKFSDPTLTSSEDDCGGDCSACAGCGEE